MSFKLYFDYIDINGDEVPQRPHLFQYDMEQVGDNFETQMPVYLKTFQHLHALKDYAINGNLNYVKKNGKCDQRISVMSFQIIDGVMEAHLSLGNKQSKVECCADFTKIKNEKILMNVVIKPTAEQLINIYHYILKQLI